MECGGLPCDACSEVGTAYACSQGCEFDLCAACYGPVALDSGPLAAKAMDSEPLCSAEDVPNQRQDGPEVAAEVCVTEELRELMEESIEAHATGNVPQEAAGRDDLSEAVAGAAGLGLDAEQQHLEVPAAEGTDEAAERCFQQGEDAAEITAVATQSHGADQPVEEAGEAGELSGEAGGACLAIEVEERDSAPARAVIPTGLAPHSGSLQPGTAILVARHGHRLDDEFVAQGRAWVPSTDTPWDPPMTEIGRRQASALGRAAVRHVHRLGLPPICRVFASPFVRCFETGAMVAKEAGLGSVCMEPSLSESFGEHFYRSWCVPGANGNWGGPDGCGIGVHVAPERLKPASRQPASRLLLPERLLQVKALPARADPAYEPYLPFSALTFRWGHFETEEQLAERMRAFFDFVADTFQGRTVILISHGGPLEALLTTLEPGVKASMPGYCGLFVLHRPYSGDGTWRAPVAADMDHMSPWMEPSRPFPGRAAWLGKDRSARGGGGVLFRPFSLGGRGRGTSSSSTRSHEAGAAASAGGAHGSTSGFGTPWAAQGQGGIPAGACKEKSTPPRFLGRSKGQPVLAGPQGARGIPLSVLGQARGQGGIAGLGRGRGLPTSGLGFALARGRGAPSFSFEPAGR